jgi:SAM-dependent methyltransferase
MWDERYSEDGFAYGTKPNDFLAEQAHRIPDGPVLCLAEGEGRNAVYVAGLGHPVTAVDSSVVGLEKTRALAAKNGCKVDTVHADLAEYVPSPGAWAGVVSIWCHVPPPVRKALHKSVVDALIPGGVLILEAYTPDQVGRGTGGPPVAGPMMTAAALREELKGLQLELIEETEREIHEGRYHNGWSAVVRVVGRKPA